MSHTDALRSYAVASLVDHLVSAGRRDAVHGLLGKEGREGSAWYELKQRADDDRGYERDLALAWRLADEEFHEAADRSQRAGAIALQVRYALISASLDGLSDRLTPQRLRRHVVRGEWSMARARAAAARASDPALRAQMFAALVTAGTNEDVQGIIGDALAHADRDEILAAVTERLAPKALAGVIAASRAFGGQDVVAAAIAATANRLPKRDVEPVLREAMRLTSRDARARAVVALAPRAPARLADAVVLDSGLLDDDGAALALLEAQPSALSLDAAKRGLEVLRRLPPSARRSDVAIVLLATLPAQRRARALPAERDAARRIRALDRRVSALARLGLGDEAVRAVADATPAQRAAMIVAIAPHLTPSAARRALDAVAAIESPSARGEALAALAPVVEPRAAMAVLKLVETVRPEAAKARVLASLAPRLPEARLSRALRLGLRLRDIDLRSVVVSALEPRLSDRHRSTALYRRRAGGTSRVDVEAALRAWSTPSAAVRAPTPERAPAPVAPVPAVHDERRLDKEGLRQRLIETIRTEQSDYATLRKWLGKALPDARNRLADRAADPPATRKGPWAATTLQKLLREQIKARIVELDDPRIQAALELADPVTVRTALHLGLDIAESRESDDGLFDETYQETPTVPDIVPVFAHHGRLAEAIAAARDLRGPYRRSEALGAALPLLSGRERAPIAGEALDSLVAACRSTSPRMWWTRLAVIELLAPALGRRGTRALAGELRTLSMRSDAGVPPGDARHAIVIEAQLCLALRAPPSAAAGVVVDGLAVAARVHSEKIRVAVLDAFVPWLPAPALAAAAATARTLLGRGRATALAAVARRAGKLRAAREASDLIEEIARQPELFTDPMVSALVGRHAKLLTPAALAAIWCPEAGTGLLHRRNGASRDDLTRILGEVAPLMKLLGGPQTARAVGRANDMIGRWWP